MKTKVLGFLLLAIVSCVFSACKNDRKTLQELLQEERKAIDRFIIMNDFVILKNYPKDGVFGEKEYFKTDDGLFIQVVDSGNGKRVQLLDDVCIRYEYSQLIKEVAKGDSVKYSFNFYEPFSFIYGIPDTYRSYYSYVCEAWVIPLKYVGEDAILNLIIPSSIGSYNDNSSVVPVFYRNLHYTRFN